MTPFCEMLLQRYDFLFITGHFFIKNYLFPRSIQLYLVEEIV